MNNDIITNDKRSVGDNYIHTTGLFIVQEAARRVGIPAPHTIDFVTEADPSKFDADAILLLAGLNTTINEILASYNLSIFINFYTTDIQMTAGDSILKIELPKYFGSLISGGIYVLFTNATLSSDSNLVLFRENTYDDCLTNLVAGTAILPPPFKEEEFNQINRFKIINSEIIAFPILDTKIYLAKKAFYFYKPSIFVNIDTLSPEITPPQKYFKTDIDETILDAELLVRGTALYYQRSMGIDFAMALQEYQNYLQALVANEILRNKIVDTKMLMD